MPPGLTLKIDLSGDKEVARRFASAGDRVREAVKGVFADVGKEIVAAARASVPVAKARSSIFYRVIDGAGGKGTGRIRLVVDTRRRMRWVQQFEEGTVGTAGPDAPKPASYGPTLIHVRSHERRAAGATHRTRVFRGGKAVGGTWLVKAYDRTQHMPVRPFMGPAFRAVAPTIVERIERAVGIALNGDTGGGI